MTSVMKLRSAGKMLERAAVSWMKMNEKEFECPHRSSAVYHTPSDTCAACLPSGFGSNIPQQDERDVPGTINQQCIDTSMLNTDDFKLDTDSKEFISLSKQSQFDYQEYPAQSMILNSSADEFIPQLIKSLPKKHQMFNPSAEEFIPQLIKSLPKKHLMFNPSAEEFIPQLNAQSLLKMPLVFNPNAEEFTPQLRVQSHPKKIMMFNTSAEEFIPQLISKSFLTKTLMFNPSAEEFIPQLNAQSLLKMPLVFNPNAEEFTPQLRVQSHPKKIMMFNTSAEEFIPQLISKSFLTKTLMFNPSAEEFIPQLNAQSLLKMPLVFNPNAEEFTPQLSVQSHPKKIMMFNTSAEEFIPQLISKSFLTKTLMFNPSAEEFIPQLNAQSLLKMHLMFNPNSEEFTPQLSVQSHPKKILMFNPNAEEFTPHLSDQSHRKETLMFNPSAEEFIPQMISQSLPKNHLMFNPSAVEFIPQLRIQSDPEQTLMFNPCAEECIPHLSDQSHPKETLMFNPSAEEFIPQMISQLLPKNPLMFNASAESQTLNTYSEELRNCASAVREIDETSQNVQQNPSALDVYNTPVTSNPGGSFILRRNKGEIRPRKLFVEECIGDVAKQDNQIAYNSEEEKQPTRSWTFNLSAKPFFSRVRNASPSSRNTNDTSHSLEQTHSESDPVKTKTSLNNSSLVRKESFRQRLDACNEQAADDDDQTASNSQDSQLTESQKLNPCAHIFIPHPTDMSPVLLNTEIKNDNLEKIHAHSNVDKHISFELMAISSVCSNGTAHVTEDAVEAHTSCPSQEDHFDFPTHQVESPTLNPNARTFIPLLRNMSQVSHKTDSHNAKNSGELSAIAMLNSGIQSECASLSYELIQDELQPSLSAEWRNCTSVVQEIDETCQNVLQNHSALDVYNTPVTSNAGGSFMLRRNEDELRPRKTYLEECNGDIAEEDNQTACYSQEESQPMGSWTLNPSAEPFFSLVRNVLPSSRNTNDTIDSLEQTHSESDPVKPALTQKLRELLRKLVKNSRLAREDSCRMRVDESTEDVDDDNAQTACNSQDSQFTESQKLNPCAQIFIPHPTDMSPVVLITENKNDNLEEITTFVNVENKQISVDLKTQSSVCPNGIAQATEEAVVAHTSCPSQEDHSEFPTHQDEWSTLNPNAKIYMPLLRNISQVSHKTDSYNAKNTGELSERSLHNSEIQTDCALLSYKLNSENFQPILSADDKGERDSVLNRNVAMSSSTPAKSEIQTQCSTAVTAAQRTIADVNNLTPVKADLPNVDFRRTPRRPHKAPKSQHDEFMDNPNQQSSAWLEHGTTVIVGDDHDPTSLAVRLERAETEANRLRIKVSTMTIDHALETAQHQLQIKILHNKMAANKKELANMQVLMLDLIKQVAISRVDKKLMQAELHVSHLYETMGDQVSTSDMQNSYQVLCSYMTECNVLKLDIEMLIQKLQEELQDGKQIDFIEKYLLFQNFMSNCPQKI